MKNDFKLMPEELKPREQMLRAANSSCLSPESLLAILLKTGANGCDVVELSRRLIGAFGGIERLVRTNNWRDISSTIKAYNGAHPDKRILGVGKVKILELAAAFEFVRRGYGNERNEDDSRPITTATRAAEKFRSAIGKVSCSECFWVLPVDSRHRPYCDPICIAKGSVGNARVAVKDVYSEAVRWGASAVIVAHNHPSGELSLSDFDIDFTNRLIDASELVGIPLLDHIVLGTNPVAREIDWTSIKESGRIVFPSASAK